MKSMYKIQLRWANSGIEILFKLIVKMLVVGNTADTPNIITKYYLVYQQYIYLIRRYVVQYR